MGVPHRARYQRHCAQGTQGDPASKGLVSQLHADSSRRSLLMRHVTDEVALRTAKLNAGQVFANRGDCLAQTT
jgi:hypothetical protein